LQTLTNLKANEMAKTRLLCVLFSTFKWPILQTIFPRLAFIAFKFSQPFLIEATIEYLGQSSLMKMRERANFLIGAAVLVYIGLAVCFKSPYSEN
jgi:ATP-binding cassette subfamily C (CFTR/MRP) protein 1